MNSEVQRKQRHVAGPIVITGQFDPIVNARESRTEHVRPHTLHFVSSENQY